MLFEDYFHKDAAILRAKKLWLFDMDGTICNENLIFSGTLDLLSYIKSIGGEYVFITNNSSKSLNAYLKKLRNMDIHVEVDNFFTSTQVAILYLKANFPKALVYCQGTQSFISELHDAGINVTDRYAVDADVILVGFDTELTSDKLRNTCEMLTLDIPFLATNPDKCCPVSFGFIPDCGSICQMLENATGRSPLFLGKPARTVVDIVREKFSRSPSETVVVGDRLYTDIAVGINAGVDSVCVLTGEASASDILNGSIKPSFTFTDILSLSKMIYDAH